MKLSLLNGRGQPPISSSPTNPNQADASLCLCVQFLIGGLYCYNTFYFVLFLSITNERKKTQQKDNLFVFLAELIDEWSDWRAAPSIKINFINFILRDEMLCVFLSQLAHHSSNQLHFNSFCFWMFEFLYISACWTNNKSKRGGCNGAIDEIAEWNADAARGAGAHNPQIKQANGGSSKQNQSIHQSNSKTNEFDGNWWFVWWALPAGVHYLPSLTAFIPPNNSLRFQPYFHSITFHQQFHSRSLLIPFVISFQCLQLKDY